MTTDQKLADLKQALAWAQLAGWQARGIDQRELLRKVETLKRQIALIEQNTGKNNAQSIPT